MEIKKNYLSVFAPTKPIVAKYMIELAEPKGDEVFLDIGCGKGGIIFEALKPKYGFKRVVGIEYNAEFVKEVIHNLKDLGLEDRAEIIHDDVFNINLSKIDPNIATVYLVPTGLEKLKPKLEKELKPGTRVVSKAFEIWGWKPSKTRFIPDECEIYLYRIDET